MFSKKHIFILCIAAAFALLGRLYLPGLRAEEPRRAVVAQEMVFTGDFIVPHVGGWNYYNKPPLFNWVLAGLFKLFGSFSEVLVRLPGLIGLFLSAFFLYRMSRRYVSEETALLSAFAMLACGDMLFYATIYAGEIDLFHMGLVFAQAAVLFSEHRKGRFLSMFLWSYLLAAIGVLTKGLPSLLTQACTLLAILIYHGQWKMLFNWRHFAGIGLFFLVCGSYFYAYAQRSDVVVFLINLVKESSQKSVAEASAWKILPHLVTFWLQVFKIVLPWGFLMFFLFKKERWAQIKANPLLMFSVLFVGSNILVYWISPQTRDRYLYQFMPFLLLLLAWGYEQGKDNMPRSRMFWNGISAFLVGAAPLFFLSLPFIKPLWNHMDLPWLVMGVFLVLSLVVLIGFWREKTHRLFWMILCLLVIRMGYNYAVLPHHHKAFGPAEYIAHTAKMHELSGGEPIHYTGWVTTLPIDLELPVLPEVHTTLSLPTHMHHQLHYYLGRKTEQVFQFDAVPESGRFYIAKEVEIKDLKIGQPITPLYRFKISYDKSWMVMFRMP